MCGRFALHASPEVVSLQFGLRSVPAFETRYNIAPTSTVLIVRSREAALVRWGLVPHWAKDSSIGAKLANARAETVAQKPSFRDAYRARRCLVPASGFYEWKPEAGRKQPYYIRPAQGELFAFAGLWERWNDLETCALITTDANEPMRAIHDRMPVIVAREDREGWLEGSEGLLRPCPPSAIAIHRVSRAVNDARNDSPALIDPEGA
jgi:putative SOS response-associated peptidase YedK